MRLKRVSVALAVAGIVAGALGVAPAAGAAVGTLDLTSICTFSDGPQAGQHLWRVTSTFAADQAYTSGTTSSSKRAPAPVPRMSSPGSTWFLGAAVPTVITYTNDSGSKKVTRPANNSECTDAAPEVTISAPVDGATYTRGQAVAADFACTGVELVSCVGTVGDGANIDTESAGTKTFEVTATAWDGATVTTTASYEVYVSNRAAGSACTYVPPPGAEVTSAQISWYPANPGAMSGLEVGCVFRNDTGNSMVSPSFTIHDSEMVVYHNGAARTVTTSGATASGVGTIQLSTAARGIAGLPTTPAQMNRVISGDGLAPGTFVTSMTAAGLVSLSQPTTGSIPTGSALKIENASARAVSDAVSSGADLLTSATANFTPADVGLSVAGTGVPPFTTIAAVASGTEVQLSNPWPDGGLTSPTVRFGESLLVSSVRQVTGATTTTSARITSPSGVGGFEASDIGLRVTGSCTQLTDTTADDTTIPPNTYILSTPSPSSAVTTGGLTAGWSGCTIVVGEPNANAPIDGEVMASQAMQLNVDPAAIAGVDQCSNEEPEALTAVGTWHNPGDFRGAGLSHEQPGPTPTSPGRPATNAVGQIFFDTVAGGYSALVIERKVFTAGDPNGSAHYDVVFPFMPVALAMCASSLGSPGFGFLLDVEANTLSQAAAAAGTGRPGTNQVRSVKLGDGSGHVSYVHVDSQATPFTPAVNFRRLCVYPDAPSPINFQCGAG